MHTNNRVMFGRDGISAILYAEIIPKQLANCKMAAALGLSHVN